MVASERTLGLDFRQQAEPQPVPEPSPVVPATPFTHSEEHRHACEVRFVAAMDYGRRRDFCAGVAERRGRAPAERLWSDALAIIKAKNDNA